ncbi:MAG: PhoH family protein [Bacteroidales bacterium]|nr:PhoH family protein [Bacteroidales bacterium]
MTEKLIYLEDISPLDFYGVNNVLYEKLRGFFPRLKIVARGDRIKAAGEESELLRFETAVGRLIAYYRTCRHLTEEDVLRLANGDMKEDEPAVLIDDVIVYGNGGKSIRARTVNQRLLVERYGHADLIFASGPAGTGKTYTAIALAVAAFKRKSVKKLILTRPAVEAGEKLGFLPGDLKDKLDPYLQPLYDALHDMLPPHRLAELIAEEIVQIVPLAYMRGRTLDNACVILDEAQNATVGQLKMFLTRMGPNAKFIVTGDATQIDLPDKRLSGFETTVNILEDIPGIAVVRFDGRDIIRHPLVKHIVAAYHRNESQE